MVQKTGRCDWEPLPMEYLIAVRDQAKAAGDAETWALVREISRLHFVLLKTRHVVDAALRSDSKTCELAQELQKILEKEPLIIKRRELFKKPVLSPAEQLAMRTEKKER